MSGLTFLCNQVMLFMNFYSLLMTYNVFSARKKEESEAFARFMYNIADDIDVLMRLDLKSKTTPSSFFTSTYVVNF